jgi:hypothetical protein
MESQHAGIWNKEDQQETLRQVAELCKKAASLNLNIALDGSSFVLKSDEPTLPGGIVSAAGRLDEGLILVNFELYRGPNEARVSSYAFFRHLSNLGERIRLVKPREVKPGQSSLWVELKVQASPLSITRAEALMVELSNLKELAVLLQRQLPAALNDAELVKLYSSVAEVLEPVHPWTDHNNLEDMALIEWAKEISELLSGSINVAVAAPHQICLEAALALISGSLLGHGRSLGNLITPGINARSLMEISRKAPGTVMVEAVKINLGTNPYELANEMRSLMTSLSKRYTPVVFTGRYDELQAVFHGGQGAIVDPIEPALRRVPEISLDILTRFAVISAGRRLGGIPEAALEELVAESIKSLNSVPEEGRTRLLPALAMRNVAMWASGKKPCSENMAAFVIKTAAISETLCGLSARPKAIRNAEVQERFTRVLTNPELLTFFKDHLLAQDHALYQLCQRLEMECLTRPLHQPLRYCAQSPPGTGKSQSAVLLARILDIPYVNIDAASMSDHHTATSQLLGSGRGIVGSHQSGRLEQAAKHHTGVVLEISDLDHAVPSVRASLADLFLQVLDTGEAQSSVGAMFSCANVILVFTMNLPGGMDEKLHRGIGFYYDQSRSNMKRRVSEEIKSMLSSAFLSRVGTPIVFDPLDGKALALIVERAVEEAAISAATRLKLNISKVIIESGTGEMVLKSLDTSLISFGARALLEHGRNLAAQAVLRWKPGNGRSKLKKLVITADHLGELIAKE